MFAHSLQIDSFVLFQKITSIIHHMTCHGRGWAGGLCWFPHTWPGVTSIGARHPILIMGVITPKSHFKSRSCAFKTRLLRLGAMAQEGREGDWRGTAFAPMIQGSLDLLVAPSQKSFPPDTDLDLNLSIFLPLPPHRGGRRDGRGWVSLVS